MTATATAPRPASAPSGPVALEGRARILAFATIALGMLLAALDGTIVSTALPTIVGDLGGGNHVSWVVTSYLLAQTAITAVVGKLGDQFGRKLVFQISVTVFIVGSALCGLAEGMTWLIVVPRSPGTRRRRPHRHRDRADRRHHPAARARQVPRLARRRLRRRDGHRPAARWSAHRQRRWRWCFYVNVPLAAIVIVAARFTIPRVPGGAKPRIDYARMVAVALGASMLVLATSLGGTTYAWGLAADPRAAGRWAGRRSASSCSSSRAPRSRSCRCGSSDRGCSRTAAR